MKRPTGIRSDYELALLPWEYMTPEERAWSDSKPGSYWADVIERGERDVSRLRKQDREREAELEALREEVRKLRAEQYVLTRLYVQATGTVPETFTEVREVLASGMFPVRRD